MCLNIMGLQRRVLPKPPLNATPPSKKPALFEGIYIHSMEWKTENSTGEKFEVF